MLTLTVTGLPSIVYGLVSIPVQAVVVLTSSNAAYNQARLRVSWGDGASSELVVALPYAGTLEHSLLSGTNTVRITAVSVATPLLTTTHTSLVVVSTGPAPVASAPVVYGPVPPRINGSPSSADWCWQTASDSLILEASVTAILLTRRGERVMRPGFGSNIHRLLFSPADGDLRTLVSDEVRQSISASEPRVDIVNVDCKVQGRAAVVTAVFKSKLTSSQFVLVIPFHS